MLSLRIKESEECQQACIEKQPGKACKILA